MGGLRRFSADDDVIAGHWSDSPLSADAWTLLGPVGMGISGPRHIERADGLRGVAKAAFDAHNVASAAHERIASELAALIGLPVPPVQLWEDPASGNLYAISLRAFKQALTWYQAGLAGATTSSFMNRCGPALAAGFVFHSWIGDTDHDQNPGNLLVDGECDPSTPGLAFIDHAWSMSRTWNDQTPSIRKPFAYFVAPSLLDGTDLAAAVARIEAVTSGAIDKIVNDVPRKFLSEDKAELIAKGLRHSRDTLRGSFP